MDKTSKLFSLRNVSITLVSVFATFGSGLLFFGALGPVALAVVPFAATVAASSSVAILAASFGVGAAAAAFTATSWFLFKKASSFFGGLFSAKPTQSESSSPGASKPRPIAPRLTQERLLIKAAGDDNIEGKEIALSFASDHDFGNCKERRQKLFKERRQKLFNAVRTDDTDFLIKYINSGKFNYNVKNSRGSLLHEACRKGHLECARILIDQCDLDVNVRNSKKKGHEKTPLHVACERGYTDLVKLLIKKGADVNLRDSNGKTAKDYFPQANIEIMALFENGGGYINKP